MAVDDIKKEVFNSLEIDETLLPVVENEEERFKLFRNLLKQRIEELAEKNMERLMWILYRIDVSEKKLAETLKHTAPENFSNVIADLIIERQLKKVESRKQFGGKENDWSFDV